MCANKHPVGRIGCSAGPATHEEAPRPRDQLQLRPVARGETREGERLATLTAGTPTAGWLVPGKRWWPKPHTGSPNRANAVWTQERCKSCGCWQLSLVASTRLRRGAEIVVQTDKEIRDGTSRMPHEVTFDGGARARNGVRAAGAGAILWGPADAKGHRQAKARALVALPAVPYAQVAEAWGCRLALALLMATGAEDRRAEIIGDNLNVVRYGAETGAIRQADLHEVLADPMAAAAERGWHIRWKMTKSGP